MPIGEAYRQLHFPDSAELLEHLYTEVLTMMNAGARLDEIFRQLTLSDA